MFVVIEAGLFRPSRATWLTPFFSSPPASLSLSASSLFFLSSPIFCHPLGSTPFSLLSNLLLILPPSSTPPRSLPSGHFLPSFLLLPAFFPSSPLRGLQSPQPLLIKLREIGCPRPNNPRGRQAGRLLPLFSPPPHFYITAISIWLYSTSSFLLFPSPFLHSAHPFLPFLSLTGLLHHVVSYLRSQPPPPLPTPPFGSAALLHASVCVCN